jgi:flagellar motor switch protein FliM
MDNQERKHVLSDRVLSQEEIDLVFRNMREGSHGDLAARTQPYDFRRPDRIAKDQLRAIHLLHENFARSLASSLSAYLRAYVIVNLVSVEQLSFREFTQCLPSPTFIAALSMTPYEGSAVLELNPSLVFPILEMLLGGTGKTKSTIVRETTEIEQSIMESLLRIVLQNLKTAWHAVTNLDFAVESHETEPTLLQILAPNEAVVTVGIEVRIGDNSGMMNIGIPSIIVKMLRHKFDQQWSVRKTEVTEDEHSRVLRLIKPATLSMDARLRGPTISFEDIMKLEDGDVLKFDYNLNRPVDLSVNGKLKFRGHVTTVGGKKAFAVQQLFSPAD